MAFPTGWNRKCALTIQHGQVPANQTAFPVLLTEATLPSEILVSGGGNAAQADGGDIRFSSDSAGASQLACEIALWNQSTGKAEIWVPVSILTASDVTIYVWYNAGGGLSQPGAGTTYGSQAVWDANYAGVWHLADGSTLGLGDSTSNGLTLTNNNSATAAAGKIDGGVGLASASSQYLSRASFTMPLAATLSVWIKNTSFPNAYNTAIGMHHAVAGGGFSDPYMDLHIKSTGKLACYLAPSGGGGNSPRSYDGIGLYTLSTGTWYHIALGYSTADALRGYVNGLEDHAVTPDGTLLGGTVLIEIGQDTPFTPRFVNGVIDEPRVSSVMRSANWILTEYNNQSSPSTFVVAGTPGGAGGGGGSAVIAAIMRSYRQRRI